MFFAPMRHKDAGLSHNPLKAIVSPRPIGWIASKGADGSFNLAPYSFFNAISEDPAMVMFSVQSDSETHIKDSLRNVEETGEFVVNIVSQGLFEAMNISSGTYAYGENEFTLAGLDMVPSQTVAVPRAGGVPALGSSPPELRTCARSDSRSNLHEANAASASRKPTP